MVTSPLKPTILRVQLRERRYLVFSGASIIVALLLTLFVLIPRLEVLMGANETLNVQTDELTRLAKKREFLEAFNTGDFKLQNNTVNQILPVSKPFMQLLYSLQNLSKEQQVTLGGLELNPGSLSTESAEALVSSGAEDVQKLPLTVTLLGSSENIRSAIDKMSYLAPALDVKKFSLGVKAIKDVPQTVYEAKIEVDALYAPMKVVAGGTVIPATLTTEEEAYLPELKAFLLPPANEADFGDVSPAPAVGKENPFAF